MKFILQIDLEKFLQLKIIKNTVPWRYAITDFTGAENI